MTGESRASRAGGRADQAGTHNGADQAGAHNGAGQAGASGVSGQTGASGRAGILDGALQIVGHSEAIRAVLEQADRLAGVPRPVLIRGERGTGKELVAARLHYAGPRGGRALVCVNCGSMTDELLSAELFGHEKGAFTGADQARTGKFEQADGGTLFLDEIGNMSPRFQEHVLRVIEYQQFTRVRGSEPVNVNVRVVAATNADLDSMIASGAFRQDLYDRLAFAVIEVPPLRKRREDIPLLVAHFEKALLREMPNLAWAGFWPQAMDELCNYYWPGNVRQLRNLVERLMIMDHDGPVGVHELPAEVTALAAAGGTFEQRVSAFQQQLLLGALKQANFRLGEAAKSLGLSYEQMRYWCRKFGLRQYETGGENLRPGVRNQRVPGRGDDGPAQSGQP